jgi:hypothetical protein
MLDIQSLLVLGNVIANNMNAGVAWSLLGKCMLFTPPHTLLTVNRTDDQTGNYNRLA